MNEDLKKLFAAFSENYDWEGQESVWKSHSACFRRFWEDRVLNDTIAELNDVEIDQIVRILDRHGKGNTKESQAVARVMIPQGVWRRMFNDIHSTKTIRDELTAVLTAHTPAERAAAVDRLYSANEGRRNSLTGKSANAINAMLAAYNPLENLSIVSLKHRFQIIDRLGFPSIDPNASVGELVTGSNESILEGLKALGVATNARALSVFCYTESVRARWWADSSETEEPEPEPEGVSHPSEMLFYMESQLEDFLIENWDNTDLGRRFDLVKNDQDEIVSQQYSTDIGRIDILARDRSTSRYVVIELKKNQSSDDTIGQLARYMGWVDEHLAGGKRSMGVIIASNFDRRLHYASRRIEDVELYEYKVDFHLRPSTKA